MSSSVKSLGGMCLKLLSAHISGLPDRLCLFPGGTLLFVEVKSTGQKPKRIQKYIHERLRKLGFDVEVIENTDQLKELIKRYERN